MCAHARSVPNFSPKLRPSGGFNAANTWPILDFSSLMRILVGSDYESWWIPLYWICNGLRWQSCDICVRWLYSLNDQLPSKKTLANKSLRSCFYLVWKRVLVNNLSLWKWEFLSCLLSGKLKLFPFERYCTRNCFDRDEKINKEMSGVLNYRAQTSNERFNIHNLPSISDA